jgi:hypothetical protein
VDVLHLSVVRATSKKWKFELNQKRELADYLGMLLLHYSHLTKLEQGQLIFLFLALQKWED